jgi:hypothetical protein
MITNPDLRDSVANFNYLSNNFMTDDPRETHCRQLTMIGVNV